MSAHLHLAIVITLASIGLAKADDNCHRPVAQWQPREAVAARAATLGVQLDRLRIDDGCYELRGRDANGNKVLLTLDPATLDIVALRVRFRPGAPTTPYLPERGTGQPKTPSPSTQTPS